MVNPPDIYTGAQFTVRYGDCVQRMPDYIPDDGYGNPIPFGFGAAIWKLQDMGIIMSGWNHFGTLWADLEPRLTLRNWAKELSAETPDAWTMLCAQRIAEVAEKYEPVLAMESTTGFDITNPSKESRIIEYGHVIEGQVQDTPYGQLDATSDYVSGKTAEQHSGQDTIHERNELDADILMDFRRKWDATINKIIEEFDVLFIRITGADFIA